jgi:hypothetical protein
MLKAARKAQHSHPHRSRRAVTKSLERADTRWNEHEWQHTVEGPHGAPRGSRCQESREHFWRAAVEDIRVLETSGEVGEHAKKRKGASDERYAAGQDRSP